MQLYTINTPNNKHQINTQIYTTPSLVTCDDCPYCQMKRKFNIGDTHDKKCVTHSIQLDMSQQEEDQKYSGNQYLNANQMIDSLKDVQSSLDYYWNHLRQLSGGNPSTIHKQLSPVLQQLQKVQQKINRFFYQTLIIQQSKIKSISTQPTLHKKTYHHHAGSEKFIRSELQSIFDFQENTQTDLIKQWVNYFYKIVQLRVQPEGIDLLPLEEELEMKIFKQSMEKKFMGFVQEISRYEQKVRDVLTKLIFYMEKSSEIVSDKQLEEDILFIEGQQMAVETRQAELELMMLVQASTTQDMLSKCISKC